MVHAATLFLLEVMVEEPGLPGYKPVSAFFLPAPV